MRNENLILLKGVLWSFGGQALFMLVMFLTNVLLTRILSPEEFGKIGILMFFVLLFNVLVESGLGGALVRKLDAKEIDFSTIFIFNLAVGFTGYLLLFLSAPLIASYYSDLSLIKILYVLGLIILINSFQVVQNARLIKESRFKQISIYRLVSAILSSGIGLFLAYIEGVGVWAIVFMQLSNVLINTILLNIFENNIKSLAFSKESFRSMYKFGVNTTLASTINTFFENIYNLIIGKYFSLEQTGFYYQGKRLQEVPFKIINMLLQGPVFSSFARLQDDKQSFLKTYNNVLKMLTICSGFISGLFFLFSDRLVLTIYGSDWLQANFYIEVLAIGSFFYILEMLNRVVYKTFNRTTLILRLEILKKIIQTISIAIALVLASLDVLIIGYTVSVIIGYCINCYYLVTKFNFFTWRSFKVLFNLIAILTVFIYVAKLILHTLNSLVTALSIFLIFSCLCLYMLRYFKLLNFIKLLRNTG